MAVRGSNTTFEDMWVGFNMSDFTKFDDIVMYCKTKDEEEVVYCMQIKLRTGMLQKQQFIGKSGDFSLLAYQPSFENIKKKVSEFMKRNVHFKCGFITSMATNTKKTEWYLPVENDLFTTSSKSRLLKLNIGNIKVANGSHVLEDAYLNNILVSTDHVNASFMETLIKEEIKNLMQAYGVIQMDYDQVTRNYLSYISKWVEGDFGGWYTLTKTVVLYKLIELAAERYKPTLLVGCKNMATILSWIFLTRDKSLIIISNSERNLKLISDVILYRVSKIYPPANGKNWGDKIDKNEFYGWFKDGAVKTEMLRLVGRYGDIFVGDLYTVLWKLGNVPVVFTNRNEAEYIDIINILKTSNFSISAVVLSDVLASTLPVFDFISKPFIVLSDLRKVARKVVLEQNVFLQGRGPIKLGRLMGDELCQQITADDVIKLIEGNYNIGNVLEPLPDIHINRSVPRVGISPDVLRYKHQALVINSREDSLKQYMDTNIFHMFNFLVEKNIETEDYIFRTECDNFKDYSENLQYDNIHYLLLHESIGLEWIKSRGTVEGIRNFRRHINENPINVKDVVHHFSNSINIISADPGAGKTILMHYLALHCEPAEWVLLVDLNKYMDYYDCKDFSQRSSTEHLRYFNDQICKAKFAQDDLSKTIFEILLRQRRLLVLLDGFDEIAPLFTEEVTSLALALRCDNYPIWLTTRPVMRNHIESVFDTFSLTLTLFNDEEQAILLTSYYNLRVVPSDFQQIKMVQYFVHELLTKCKTCLNDFDNRFMGIPLQIFLLGQNFSESCHRYVKTGQMEIVNFDLLDLYDKFTQMKTDIVVAKFGHNIKFTHKNLHENHCLYALNVLFSKEDLADISDYMERKLAAFVDDIKDATNKMGIVVADINTNFVHRSVSEYFAAKWLCENLHSDQFGSTARKLLEKLFDPNFSVVRNVFDRILAKKSALLTAIVNQQFTVVEELINKEGGDREGKGEGEIGKREGEEGEQDADSEGRSTLCLAAAWGDIHILPELGAPRNEISSIKRNSNASRIMKLLLEKNVPYTIDPLLNLTPLDYAIKTDSLAAADQLLEKFWREKLLIDCTRDNDYLYVCAMYNYPHLAKKILEEWASPFFLQIDAKFSGRTVLQIASQRGHFEMVKLLLEHKADPSMRDKDGDTAFDIASKSGNIGAMQVLRNVVGRGEVLDRLERRSRHDLFKRSERSRANPFSFGNRRLNEAVEWRRNQREDRLREMRRKIHEQTHDDSPD